MEVDTARSLQTSDEYPNHTSACKSAISKGDELRVVAVEGHHTPKGRHSSSDRKALNEDIFCSLKSGG